jgi:hypothetical protein
MNDFRNEILSDDSPYFNPNNYNLLTFKKIIMDSTNYVKFKEYIKNKNINYNEELTEETREETREETIEELLKFEEKYYKKYYINVEKKDGIEKRYVDLVIEKNNDGIEQNKYVEVEQTKNGQVVNEDLTPVYWEYDVDKFEILFKQTFKNSLLKTTSNSSNVLNIKKYIDICENKVNTGGKTRKKIHKKHKTIKKKLRKRKRTKRHVFFRTKAKASRTLRKK